MKGYNEDELDVGVCEDDLCMFLAPRVSCYKELGKADLAGSITLSGSAVVGTIGFRF